MRSRKKTQRVGIGAATLLLITACGPADQGTANSAPDTTLAEAIATTTTTGSGSDTTSAETITTTTAAATTTSPVSMDAEAVAMAKAQAALDALPESWTGQIASDLGEEAPEGDDIVFFDCLDPDDYDLDDLDADSDASWEMDAQGPASDTLGRPMASIEGRVFSADADVNTIFAVLEKVLGTDEGRGCLAEEVPGQLSTDMPEDVEFDLAVEGTTIEGADVGARLMANMSAGGLSFTFYIDMVATRVDERCTVFGTFWSFGEPVDQEAASAMFTAAVNAG